MTVDLSGADWRKSTRSANNGQCVEVAFVGDVVAVRDSKHPTGPALIFQGDEWAAFVEGVAAGEFDRA
jgi:hypothetical protein